MEEEEKMTDIEFLKMMSKSKSVNQIVYPDGSIGYLNINAIIL